MKELINADLVGEFPVGKQCVLMGRKVWIKESNNYHCVNDGMWEIPVMPSVTVMWYGEDGAIHEKGLLGLALNLLRNDRQSKSIPISTKRPTATGEW